ncbi:MAG: hypothetical protein IKF39_01070 [Oscillospiraceae bacterium]|nr:hypothetical protein [Oscillospiraceae bacterium]
MSDSRFEKYKAQVREALEKAHEKRGLKRGDLTTELIGMLVEHEQDDPIFRASQLHELFRLPDEIMEEESLRRRGYEV